MVNAATAAAEPPTKSRREIFTSRLDNILSLL
jgi:hypothetical protein